MGQLGLREKKQHPVQADATGRKRMNVIGGKGTEKLVLHVRVCQWTYLNWSSWPGMTWQVPPLRQGKLMQALMATSQLRPCEVGGGGLEWLGGALE